MVVRPAPVAALPNPFIEPAVAPELLRKSTRLLVIGCSGGGKSTLSFALSEALDLPHVPMDREVFWLAGWKKRNAQEQRERVADIVARDRWIIDGSGKSTFDLRLPRTHAVIWLHLPRWQCLASVYWRAGRSLGRVRPELAEGCPEQWPDKEFRDYIWHFERRHLPQMCDSIAQYGPNVPIIWLSRRRDVNSLIDQLGQSA